mmetsp:Transcript_2396/g.2488  ORF Transcript_2396/g.2488 Transcript_2396/m.2488 type:complete len:276 (-) Transcript_2396:147-974(-)
MGKPLSTLKHKLKKPTKATKQAKTTPKMATNTTTTKSLIAITGASSGIGEATARLFADAGHPLLLMARRVDNMEALKLDNCLCVKTDVTDYDQVEAAVKQGESVYGPVGLLVNNAGVMLLGQTDSQTIEEWEQMIDVNVKGVLNGIKVVYGGMKERKMGTIVNVSSVAGRKGFDNHAVYCGTKFAVHAFTDQMRAEAAAFDVRFITIAPGVVETELLGHTTDSAIVDGYKQWKESLDSGKGLAAIDVAEAIGYAYNQPQRVCIREIVLAPTTQGP